MIFPEDFISVLGIKILLESPDSEGFAIQICGRFDQRGLGLDAVREEYVSVILRGGWGGSRGRLAAAEREQDG